MIERRQTKQTGHNNPHDLIDYGFEVLASVTKKSTVFSGSLMPTSVSLLGLFFYPEDGGSVILRNVGPSPSYFST
jgi:hypothetical protein